jgi:HAD superfamily hydrolase (TIGR01458 family)
MRPDDVQCICLDVDGTLTRGVGGPPIPGAGKAVARLRSRYPVRLVTNATSRLHASLAGALQAAGFLVDPAELVTPGCTARRILESRGHAAGILLVDDTVQEDYRWFRGQPDGPAVLLGTEGHSLRIEQLQPAFRALLAGAEFYTLQANRFFRSGEDLVTDLGPLAAFLEHASGRKALNLGKPSPLVFEAVAAETGAPLERILMVGDDAEYDASGAVALGMGGVLVRTGKYRPGDEVRVEPRPTAVLGSLADLPGWLGFG